MPEYDEVGDSRFRSQFELIRDAFRNRDPSVEIAAATYARRDIEYLYAMNRLLVRTPDVERVLATEAVRGLQPLESEGDTGLTVLSTAEVPVPEAVARLDAALGERGVVTPDHVVYACPVQCCPAVEPDRPDPCCDDVHPCPPQRDGNAGSGIMIGVSDTGLLPGADQQFPWLAGVTGEPDTLPPAQNGVQPIPPYAGHGTFIAGVARCIAPAAGITVVDHFPTAGAAALLESEIVGKLIALLALNPRIISLSAGTTTRADLPALSFDVFWSEHLIHHPEVLLVAAAGNDSTDRRFWPAAFDWSLSVGALAADQHHRAWFSNFDHPWDPWVDVFAPGEGLVNAYATGEYTYSEEPRKGVRQEFAGMARWSGTSFATPLVAALVATWMSGKDPQTPAAEAKDALIAAAAVLPDVGKAVSLDFTI